MPLRSLKPNSIYKSGRGSGSNFAEMAASQRNIQHYVGQLHTEELGQAQKVIKLADYQIQLALLEDRSTD